MSKAALIASATTKSASIEKAHCGAIVRSQDPFIGSHLNIVAKDMAIAQVRVNAPYVKSIIRNVEYIPKNQLYRKRTLRRQQVKMSGS